MHSTPSTDNGPAWQQCRGLAGDAIFTSADASGAAAAVTKTPVAGAFLVIDDLIVSVGAALTVTFTEETTGTVVAKIYMAANTTVNLVTRGKRKLVTSGKGLKVQTSGAGNIAVECLWHCEP